MVMELDGNCNFTLTTGNANRCRYDGSRTAYHRDLSWHSPSSFTSLDLPTTVPRKYAYADDLTIMHTDGDWQEVEGVLSKDMATA